MVWGYHPNLDHTSGNLRRGQNLEVPDRAEDFETSFKSVQYLEKSFNIGRQADFQQFSDRFGMNFEEFSNFRPDQELQDFVRDASSHVMHL